MNKEYLSKALKEIIQTTSMIEDDNHVHGMNADFGHIDDLIRADVEILERYQRQYKKSMKKLKRKILNEMVIPDNGDVNEKDNRT